MSELVVLRGLPASGKTTLAREWVDRNPAARVRVNRDDLRHMMFGRYWDLTLEQETAVSTAAFHAVTALLRTRRSAVLDDTNLLVARVQAWDLVARHGDADFTVIDVKTPLDECVRRDLQRAADGDRHVGPAVISNMAERYELRNGNWLPPYRRVTQAREIGQL